MYQAGWRGNPQPQRTKPHYAYPRGTHHGSPIEKQPRRGDIIIIPNHEERNHTTLTPVALYHCSLIEK